MAGTAPQSLAVLPTVMLVNRDWKLGLILIIWLAEEHLLETAIINCTSSVGLVQRLAQISHMRPQFLSIRFNTHFLELTFRVEPVVDVPLGFLSELLQLTLELFLLAFHLIFQFL